MLELRKTISCTNVKVVRLMGKNEISMRGMYLSRCSWVVWYEFMGRGVRVRWSCGTSLWVVGYEFMCRVVRVYGSWGTSSCVVLYEFVWRVVRVRGSCGTSLWVVGYEFMCRVIRVHVSCDTTSWDVWYKIKLVTRIYRVYFYAKYCKLIEIRSCFVLKFSHTFNENDTCLRKHAGKFLFIEMSFKINCVF